MARQGAAGGHGALARAVRRLVGRLGRPGRAAGSEPTAYEQVTRKGLEDLSREVERLEMKINAMMLAVFSAVVVEIYRTLAR